MPRKNFASAKNAFTCGLLYCILIGLIIVAFVPKPDEGLAVYFVNTLVITVSALILWIVNDTNYAIDGDKLLWKSGPFRGAIMITSIRKITYDDGILKYQTWKPALSHKGLIVAFNKFDDIFISPKDRQEFIAALLQVNDAIEVVSNPAI